VVRVADPIELRSRALGSADISVDGESTQGTDCSKDGKTRSTNIPRDAVLLAVHVHNDVGIPLIVFFKQNIILLSIICHIRVTSGNDCCNAAQHIWIIGLARE
jgi:hypothetical protein